MKKKPYFFRKILFLIAFILIFNSLEGSANTNASIYFNESENLKYEIMTETPNEPNTNLINYTTLKIDNPEILPDETSDNENLKKNSLLWSENSLIFATFLISIISLLTLNELKKQRHLANTPKLHIISPKNNISVKNKKFGNMGEELPTEWESEDIKKHENELLPTYSIPLKIINTGSSPALNIKITWNYDYETIKYTLEQFNELELGVKCNISKLHGSDFLDFSFENRKIGYSMHLMPINIDYILPFSNLNSETEIFIPDIFSKYITLSLSVLGLSKDQHNLHDHTLDAEIEYYDNINLSHKEK